MKVYLDNAATTPIDEDVWKSMEPFLKEHFGNPSSTHSFGRTAKNGVESARRSIAKVLNVQPGQIIFTGSGTEANNTILHSAVRKGVKHIITSPIEHHAVLHTLEALEITEEIEISYVNLDINGNVELEHLELLLNKYSGKNTLVSLMHVNNEIGTILPLEKVGGICKRYGVLFHSDTVQSIGTLPINLSDSLVDFATCSAHKFHGPKGVGFIYVSDISRLSSFIHGGGQERGHRAGTENVASIIGMSKALEKAVEAMDQNLAHLIKLKSHFLKGIEQISNKVQVVGNIEENLASPKILNLCFPEKLIDDLFLFNLDLKGVAASGGSACSSGSNQGSHVIPLIKGISDCRAIRFSFSKFNTLEEIDYALSQIRSIVSN